MRGEERKRRGPFSFGRLCLLGAKEAACCMQQPENRRSSSCFFYRAEEWGVGDWRSQQGVLVEGGI